MSEYIGFTLPENNIKSVNEEDTQWFADALKSYGSEHVFSDEFISENKHKFVEYVARNLIDTEHVDRLLSIVVDKPYLIYFQCDAQWGFFKMNAPCCCCQISKSVNNTVNGKYDIRGPAFGFCQSPLCRFIVHYNWETVYIHKDGLYEMDGPNLELNIVRSSGEHQLTPNAVRPQSNQSVILVRNEQGCKSLRMRVFTIDGACKCVAMTDLFNWNPERQSQFCKLKVIIPECLKFPTENLEHFQPFEIKWLKIN